MDHDYRPNNFSKSQSKNNESLDDYHILLNRLQDIKDIIGSLVKTLKNT